MSVGRQRSALHVIVIDDFFSFFSAGVIALENFCVLGYFCSFCVFSDRCEFLFCFGNDFFINRMGRGPSQGLVGLDIRDAPKLGEGDESAR